jgi:hypothetical protein
VTQAVQRAKYPAGSCFIATLFLDLQTPALLSLMIGAGAITAEKIRLLSVTVAGDPKEEELLKYDPERFDSCATINPLSLNYRWRTGVSSKEHLCKIQQATLYIHIYKMLTIILERIPP